MLLVQLTHFAIHLESNEPHGITKCGTSFERMVKLKWKKKDQLFMWLRITSLMPTTP